MSSHENPQVAPAETAEKLREDLYLQMQKPEWKDHRRHLQDHLDHLDHLDYSNPRVLSEKNAKETLKSALLQLYGGAGTEIDPEYDDILIAAIVRMGLGLKSNVASHYLNSLLPYADLQRCRYVIARLTQRDIIMRLQPPTRETPLDAAALYGSLTDVQSLVGGGSSALALFGVNRDGSTPLSLACKNPSADVAEYLVTLAPEAGFLADHNGNTAWHVSAENGHLSVLKMLFMELENLNATARGYAKRDGTTRRQDIPSSTPNADGNWNTHPAATQGHVDIPEPFVPLQSPFYGQNLADVLQLTNNDGEIPFTRALRKRHPSVAVFLAELMDRIQSPYVQERDDLLERLTRDPDNRTSIFETYNKEYVPLRHTRTLAPDELGRAAFSGSARLVWALLQNGSPGPSRDDSIKRAIDTANFVLQRHVSSVAYEYLSTHRGKSPGEPGWWSDEDAELERVELERACTKLNEISRGYNDVLEILHNPPATVRPARESPLEQNHVHEPWVQPAMFVNEYKVELVECSNDSFLRRSVSINNALYDEGPIEIMRTTSQRTRELQAEFSGLAQTDAAPRHQEPPKVLWIHLPANNMKWHEDVCLKLNSELKHKEEETLTNCEWLSASWTEVVGNGRETNVMKPLSTARFDKGQTKCAAVYMPYVAPAWHCFDRGCDPLLEEYTSHSCVIHGTRTLDEYFYHRCRMEDIHKEMEDRNGDQVLSKIAHKGLGAKDDRVLVNVDQLWIWIVNKETIITSATHRRDGEFDPVFTSALKALQKVIDADGKSPQDAFGMASLVMNTCINLLHWQFKMNEPPTWTEWLGPWDNYGNIVRGRVQGFDKAITGTPGKCKKSLREGEICISEVFITATADAAAQESRLYQNFIDKHKKVAASRCPSTRGGHSPSSPNDRIEAAELFREIKDIRDELKMLRVIAESQRSVQKQFFVIANIQPQAGGVKDVVDDLLEMDKAVEQIETSVNRTLALQQNATAIAQADAAVYQGRIILLFTVVTIIFLPMSYFTSLFAVQVDAFLKTPPWAFGVMFGASSLISLTLALYAFYADSASAFVKRSWERPGEMWLIKRSRTLLQYLGIHRSSKEAEGGWDAGGDEEYGAGGRLSSVLSDWFLRVGWSLRLSIRRVYDKVDARAFQWYASTRASWRRRTSPDTTLPRAESTTPSPPSDSTERRSEKLHRLSLGMRLTPWAHGVRQWLMARRQRGANNDDRSSPSPVPSVTSVDRQSPVW